jgi:hypothetical protein|tara:strand:+ start:2690 stop:3211 length:522 start_codon:yes stop_codon:yes gene_type:complete
MILNGFDINANFWILNPQLKIPEPFAKIYKEDRTKNKLKSSKIMWGIALLVDPDSKFSNISYNTRKEMISKDYLKDEKFHWHLYKDAIIFYERSLISPAKRQLMVWNKKMDEKTIYLDTLTYEENADTIEGLLKTNVKLFEDLERLLRLVDKEKNEGATKGGAEESASEKGLI